MEGSLGRAMGPAEEAMDMEIPDPGLGPEGAMVRRQDLGQVDKALNALPVALRECLVLRDWRSFPTRILRRSPASRSVRSCRAFRARQALQKGAINIVSQQAGSHLPGNVVATAGVDTSRAG
jgi:DNA-directed RNA polymerase specialized sigma24 family protein